jgi:N-methylhydantoinase A
MHSSPGRWSIGIDVGGTFVDIVAVSTRGMLKTAKRARDERSAAEAVLHTLDDFLKRERIGAADVERVLHGTTVATNALLERRQPPVGMLLTRGFRDILTLGRQSRRDLYARFVPRQTPVDVFPEALRFEIEGRIDASGREILALNEEDVRKAGAALVASGTTAAGICFLHAHANPEHELRARDLLSPALQLSLSSEVDPRPREYERALTTALDAYVKAAVAGYVDAFRKGLALRRLPAPLLMRAAGGVADAPACLERPLSLAMSGPAAAVSGACALLDGETRAGLAMSLDVGGTTTDVALLEAGVPRFGEALAVADLLMRMRSVEVTSIAVGGGSLVRINAAGGLRIGPDSSGAFPGPASFARGGQSATITDAFAVIGLLPGTLAGDLPLDAGRAREAVRRDAAGPLGTSPEDAAWSIISVANAMLAESVKQVALARGRDPRDATLVAAGGGGGLHVAEVAKLVGARRALIPPGPGVIAAYGLLCSPALSVLEQALDVPLESAQLAASARGLLHEASRMKPLEAYGASALVAFVDVCYLGQEFSLEVPYDPAVDTALQLVKRFDEEHRRIRGQEFQSERRARGLRVAVQQAAPRIPVPEIDYVSPKEATRRIFVPAQIDCPILPRGALSGNGAGPLLIEAQDTTIWVPSGWRWHALDRGALVLEAEVSQ